MSQPFLLANRLDPANQSSFARAIQWAGRSRSHRVICLVLAIWMLNGFDLVFTILAHQQGYLHEQNPLARHFLAGGIASVVLFKVGLVLMGSYPLLRFRRAIISEMASLIILMAYGLLAVHWSECYELYLLSSGSPINIAEITPSRSFFAP